MDKTIVTERALVQRLRKHLLKVDGQILMKSRSKAKQEKLGKYYTVANNGFTVQRHIELEKFARLEKVLSAHEVLEQEK